MGGGPVLIVLIEFTTYSMTWLIHTVYKTKGTDTVPRVNGWLAVDLIGLGSGRVGLGLGLVMFVSHTVTLNHSIEK